MFNESQKPKKFCEILNKMVPVKIKKQKKEKPIQKGRKSQGGETNILIKTKKTIEK